MTASVDDPCDGVAGAAGVLGLAGFLGVLVLAAVEADVLVAELAAGGDGEDVVGGAVEAEVRNRGCASVAAAELGAGDDGDGLEGVGKRASSTVAHGTTITEASGEDVLLVNTKLIIQLSQHSFGKGNIFTSIISPTSVEAIGSNKDGRILRLLLKTIVSSTNNIAHVSIEPVVADDELVLGVGVVVLGHGEGVLSLSAVDADLFDAARGRVLAASCCLGVNQGEADGAEEGEGGGEGGPHG